MIIKLMLNFFRKIKATKPEVIIAIIACVLSTVTACFSAYASFNANDISNRAYQIEEDAYKVILPFQKPIIYQSDSSVTSYVKNVTISEEFEATVQLYVKDKPFENKTLIFHSLIDSKRVGFEIIYNLSNAGKGIAVNYTQYIFMANFNNSSVTYLGNKSLADNIYPNNPIIMEINFSFEGGFSPEIADGKELALIIRHDYYDFVSKEHINQTTWGKVRINNNKVIMMSKEEKEQLLDSYNDVVKNEMW